MSLPFKTVLVCQAQVLAEIPTLGPGRLALTDDGFLLLLTGGDGVTSVLRTAELWARTPPVAAASLPSSSSSSPLRTQRPVGQARPVKHRAGKSQAETEREVKLISQLSPLLRSGLLAYPGLQRSVI